MAATGTPTPNIGLRRPQGTDPASVDDINYNSNLLDTKLGAVGNTSVQDQIDSLNSNLTNLTDIVNGIWAPSGIEANSDLNTITTTGFYRCSSTSTATSLSNCPITSAFAMVVLPGSTSSRVVQVLCHYSNPKELYIRVLLINDGTGDWKKIDVLDIT